MKRVSHLWGKRYRRKWILWKPRLVEALRFSDYVEFGGVTVSTKDMRSAIDAIPTQDILVGANGGLQLEEIQRYFKANPEHPGTRVCAHRLANKGLYCKVKPRKKVDGVGVILKIKIRPYGRKRRG